MEILRDDLINMEQRYRAMFINSLSGYKSANLIGTIDGQGMTNLAIMSSAFHLGAQPPLMGLIVRPDVAERHTLDNIRSTGVYTINHVNQKIYRQAHQTSARYPKSISEFDAVGLTTEYRHNFTAPFVKESSISMGLELRQEYLMEINGTHLLIGEIVAVKVPDDTVSDDGFIDVAKADTLAIGGLDGYFSAQLQERLAYAKPNGQ